MKKGAMIIEVYRNGGSDRPATLGAYDPEKRRDIHGFQRGSKE